MRRGGRSTIRCIVAGGLAASASLAACSEPGDDERAVPSPPPTDSVAPVETAGLDVPVESASACGRRPVGEAREITVWHSLRNDASLKFDELVARYNSLGTGLRVVSQSQGGYSEVVAAFAEATPQTRPGLVMFDQRGLRALHDSGLFLPPAACAGGDEIVADLVPVIAATYEIDGTVVAFPYNVSTPVLMYNAATVRAAGLDPTDPPATLAELRAAAETVQTSGAAAFGLVAHDAYGPWFVTQYNARTGLPSGLADNGRGGELMDRVSFTNAATLEAFQWLQDEVASGRALWIGGNVSGADDLIKLVDLDEGAAFTLSTSASTGDIIHLLEAGEFAGAELGVAPLPGPGAPGGLVGGGAIWLTAQADPMQAGAAFEFVEWLMAPAQHAEFSAHTGYSPVRRAELDEPALTGEWAAHPQLRVGYDQLATLEPTSVWAGPVWGPGDEINQLLYGAATQVVEGGSVSEVLEAAARQADELLAVYALVQPGG